MRREELLDCSGYPYTRGDEYDEVVANPLQVGDQMRRQHDAKLVLGNGFHQVLEELSSGERIEASHRLVEDQELGSLGDCKREGKLGALAT
jgi:hypothetical protein